jgi:hypothetical protein
MLKHERPMDQWYEKKNPKFVRVGLLNSPLFYKKNVACEKTRKGRVHGIQG